MTPSSGGRRDFIQLAGGLLAAASVTPRTAARRSRTPPTPLATVFGRSPDAARAIGTRYLEAFPEEGDTRTLVSRILDAAPHLSEQIDGLGVSDLRSRFRRHFAAEFDSGDTVQIDGWVLSRTEARLCALWAVT